MRYAIFTDIHANLEALEAVLNKIDAISAKEPIDQIWFLGDLVGYGPDPNECILKLRARTDVIIAGNHDWAAVGKIDLEDFSPAARISAEWTAEQLTAEHRAFLENLPERLEKGQCTLVHGSPYGPLWEYLTEETLAERSFEHFTSRYCFVGHTHVPVIFQQPDVANTPTIPLGDTGEFEAILHIHSNGIDARPTDESVGDDDETTEMAAVRSPAQQLLTAQTSDAASAFTEPGEEQQNDPETEESIIAPAQNPPEATSTPIEDRNAPQDEGDDDSTEYAIPPQNDLAQSEPLFAEYGEEPLAASEPEAEQLALLEADNLPPETHTVSQVDADPAISAANEDTQAMATDDNEPDEDDDETTEFSLAGADENADESMQQLDFDDYMTYLVEEGDVEATTPESEIVEAEERLNGEIEELLTLLGLSQSMISVTNEMITPPEGHWEAPVGYRAIVNPGGVGQPRDGDPRAAFMIYDTEKGFEFYRIPYDFEKTQEKIINAGLPQFLAVRLQFGR